MTNERCRARSPQLRVARTVAVHRALVILVATCLATVASPPLEAEAVTPCSRGTVALTFDDGPHPTYTPQVLDVLHGRRVRATFFQVGAQVASYPRISRRAGAEGHRVANHTYRHENLTQLSSAAVADTLRRTSRAIADAGVRTPTLVRPPYGATNSRVASVISDLGMHQVLWNIDPQDWRTGRSASTIRTYVFDHLRDGGNILLHDGVGNSKATVAALPGLIDGIRSRGYCIGNLSSAGKVVPPVPAARVGDVDTAEGASGTRTTVSVPVTLSQPTSRKVTFTYRTVDGTAVSGKDFVATSGTITFAVGQTKAHVPVRVLGDALDEPSEKFRVELSTPSGATISRGAGVVRILDDDPPPSVRVVDVAVTEGDAGTTTTARVPVRLSAPSGRKITVGYTTEDGTARSGVDYVARAGTVTFAPGQTAAHVDVTVIGDAATESNETFRVTLTTLTNVVAGRTRASVTITDDDPPPPPPPPASTTEGDVPT